MRTQLHAGIALVGLTLALALPTIASTTPVRTNDAGLSEDPPPAPAVGTLVEHKFSVSPMNSAGVKDLADLRGRPVLIEFWGVH
jgi:ABC-type nitrate/sulfonate/bicarbonate transport system substrate-binding protein